MLDTLDLQDQQERGDHYARTDHQRARALNFWIIGIFVVGGIIQLIPFPASILNPNFETPSMVDIVIAYTKVWSPFVLLIILSFVFIIFRNRVQRIRDSRSATIRKRLPDLFPEMTEYTPVHQGKIKPSRRYIGLMNVVVIAGILFATVFLQLNIIMMLFVLTMWGFISQSITYFRPLLSGDNDEYVRAYLLRNIARLFVMIVVIGTPLLAFAIWLALYLQQEYTLPFWLVFAVFIVIMLNVRRITHIGYVSMLRRYIYHPKEQGDYETSLQRITSLRRMSPQNRDFMFLHGYVLADMGKWAEAESVWHEAITESQNDVPAIVSEILIALARTVNAQERFDEAIHYYETAAKIYPENSRPYRWIVEHYLLHKGDAERAMAFSDLMLRYRPARPLFNIAENRNRWYFTNLVYAWALAYSGREEQAVEILEPAKQNLVNSKLLSVQSGLNMHLARIYQTFGDKDKAIHHYQRVIEIYPDNADAQAARKALQQYDVSTA